MALLHPARSVKCRLTMAPARHLASGLVIAATALALTACGGSDTKRAAATGLVGESEVQAEPVSSAGDNPFTEPTGKDMAGVDPPSGAAGTGGGRPTYEGDLPGLYGGTRNYATCDAE